MKMVGLETRTVGIIYVNPRNVVMVMTNDDVPAQAPLTEPRPTCTISLINGFHYQVYGSAARIATMLEDDTGE